MTMTVEKLHDELLKIREIVVSKGLNGTMEAHINWVGDELDISVSANEDYDNNGYWQRTTRFVGAKTEAEDLLTQASSWAYNLPNEEGRAIEFMVQELNKLVDKLSKGHGEVATRAWEEVAKMILAQAEGISKNGLPSPISVARVV